ncbi:hypothetical protein THRCLA_23266 [Thraustotheca clavata]|uniref:Uncharacterized protein n=1 Tax=Thraustotheca clavata TaxID=74557 RepID=A0A1V9Y8B8_9STRA|nr:hypothetical protein THRCLA_23266 [Thraustotheca clavata]
MPEVALRDESICKYTYKPCMNPRTIKRNGELHTLCDYHRSKANTIQREYARKKRSRRHKLLVNNDGLPLDDVCTDIYIDKHIAVEEYDIAISAEDWIILRELFNFTTDVFS